MERKKRKNIRNSSLMQIKSILSLGSILTEIQKFQLEAQVINVVYVNRPQHFSVQIKAMSNV
jgi:hypothetical protein